MLMMFYFMFFCSLSIFCLTKAFINNFIKIGIYCFNLIYYFVLLCNNNKSWIMYNNVFFLSFAVCEGALGLSILVSMIRTHGNDYFNSFGLLQC